MGKYLFTSRTFLSAAVVAALCVAGVTELYGQATSSATLQGTVRDKSQAVIPGAEVKVTSKETGLVRATSTGDTGVYRFDLLPAGRYEVRAHMQGFTTGVYENVEVAVGQTTSVDATLSPSQQSEVVTVEASGAALVDVQKTDVSRAITPAEVQELPLNGRDFANLAILAPGARPVNSFDPTKNRIGVFATNGSNGRNVNVTVNGIDNKDNTVGGPVMQLPLEAIEEFNISTQRFSASNGRSEGAAINVITKSGSNDFHGAVYFFDRNEAFNAINYFEKTENGGTGQKAPFSRQQFGGSVGGPLKKNKTFLFFALEREREQTSFNVTGTAFNELSLVKSLGAQPTQAIPTPYFDWRYNGRLDHRINDNNSFSMSYSNQNNRGLNDQATSVSDLTGGNFTTNQLIIANASLSSVISPSIVNSATVGFQYWNNLIDTTIHTVNLTFPDATFGTNPNVPQQSFQRKWQFKDDLAINRGKHSLKMGFDYVWEPLLGGFFITDSSPLVNWFDDPSVILANKTKYPNGFATPGAISSIIMQNQGDAYFFEHGKMFGLYFQDDWRIKRNLTLNLGLRWDKDYGLNGEGQEAKARAFQYLQAIHNPYGAGVPHDDNKDFSPRIGLAWDIKGSGKHIIRAGYGLYYGQTFINTTLFMLQQANPTIFTTANLTNNVIPGTTTGTSDIVPSTGKPLSQFRYGVDPFPPLPSPATTLTGAGTVGQTIDPGYRNPYTEQVNGGYTWAFSSNSVIEAEYVHVLSLHESKLIILNPKINGVRPTDALLAAAGLPVIGQIRSYQPIGRSRYDAMNLSYRRRMSRHFAMSATYVLSKGVSYNGAAASFGNGPTDLNNIFAAHDLGPSPADERHRVVVSGIVSLPWGLKVAPLMQLASGRPYNATEGVADTYGFGGGAGATHAIVLNSDPTNLLATSAFSAGQLQSCLAANTCHQLPFDYLRGENFFQLDARVSRMFKFGERAKLELIFQAFDITNRANFGASYQGNIRSTIFQQPTNFITANGVIVPRSFSGEFGARFSF
jgi:hypothetical protein